MSATMKELLIEIGCEEIPARWLPGLTTQLGECLAARLDEARLVRSGTMTTVSTPRRLTVQVPKVATRQSELSEVVTGPPAGVAFDEQGRPTRAAEGFARKHGVDASSLVRIDTPKGEYAAHRRRERGATARRVLPGVLAATLRDLAFPKQMHWDAWLDDGRGEFPFGRPIRWIIFLHGGQVVPFTVRRTDAARAKNVQPVRSANVTYGHRFFAKRGRPGRAVRVRSFREYCRALAAQYVIVDRASRRARIDKKLDASAARVGGRVAPAAQQTALLDEVPDLVEYPGVVTGSYPPEFLTLPAEVLQTTMIHHQHYVPVVTKRGRPTPHFLAVTNTPRDNVARIARNAERVLVARLRDARFFWDADRKIRLQDRLDRLDTLLFHKKLGSYRAKSERVAVLAEHVARDLLQAPNAAADARTAGALCKADLATEMVGEFPELQGVMGGVYAREQSEPETVWKAIYHHYLPIGVLADAPPSRGDLGSAATTWAAVALADKLDTVVGLFHAGEKPTGSRDPFGIRRQAQGIIRLLVDLPELTGLGVRVSLGEALDLAASSHGHSDDEIIARRTAFIRERTRYLLEERGFDARNVRAVTLQPSLDDLRPLDARRKLEVLPEFVESADFRRLATLFKRVKNIARELPETTAAEPDRASWADRLAEPAERALLAELDGRRAVIDEAVATGERYREAFAEAAAFAPTVDRFFTDVFVMVDDAALRDARLRLMRDVEHLILQLADISEIVPEEDNP